MFLDHVNSSGKFLMFLSKNIFTLVKKEDQNTVFATFSKYSSLWISLAKIV